jgi:hypothetical protein
MQQGRRINATVKSKATHGAMPQVDPSNASQAIRHRAGVGLEDVSMTLPGFGGLKSSQDHRG